MTKTCFKCHVEKDISDFYSCSTMTDGHLGKCKACTCADSRLWRANNLPRVQAYDRSRGYHGGSQSKNENKKEWIERNPEKRAAHIAVERALKKGDLIKSDACEICDKVAPLAGHHTDYSEPLIVVWLCDKCHKDVHRKSNMDYLEFLRAYDAKDVPAEYRGDDMSAAEEDREREKA